MRAALAVAAVLGTAATLAMAPPPVTAQAAAAESVRPQVAKPLQAAVEALNASRFAEARQLATEAAAVPDLNEYERFVITRVRGTAALGAGDLDLAAQALGSIWDNSRLPAADRGNLARNLAARFYEAKNFAQAAEWGQRALREQPDDRGLQLLVAQSQFQAGDLAGSAVGLQATVDADQRAGRVPDENALRLLANIRLKLKDPAGLRAALETLVRHHPKPEYWSDLIEQVRGQPGFAQRLQIDAWRLYAETGSMRVADDYVEMAETALQAGYPAEAVSVLETGFSKGVLGTGPQAGAQRELRQKAQARAAEDQKQAANDKVSANTDPNVVAAIGLNDALNGRGERGLALMQQALGKPGLRNPEDVKLRMGVAQLRQGQKAEAVRTLQSVNGTDGSGALAKLWLLRAERM